MASGDLSLLITEDVSWESFPDHAQSFVDRFGGSVIERIDTPVDRMWTVKIKGCKFWLAFDDFPLGMSLDSKGSNCNPVFESFMVFWSAETHNKPLVPTRNGEAPLLAAQRRRWAST